MFAAFSEIALLLIISAAAGLLAMLLRQPVLIAYIVVGIVAGPAILGVVTAQDQIDLFAQIGVSILLFLVGLKLDLQHVRHIGPVALATGLGQLAFTIAVGFGLILMMGRSPMEALYVAVALTFSSTIIIVKLLTDKGELDSLHGRIAVGFLIVQDLAVVLAMMAMSALRAPEMGASAVAAVLAGRIALAALLLFVLMRYILPPLVALMARSRELLLVFALAWGTSLAALGDWAGFSKEAGAFLGGFALASTPFRDAISARLTGIRDFLLVFFFIDLGAKLDFSTLGNELGPALALSLFVLVGNPLIVMAIMGYMGYRKRTGFMAGLTVAQISEFSIVFIAMGISLGHVGKEALGLTTLVGLTTITLSTYMILYAHKIYDWVAPWLGLFERNHPYREDVLSQPHLTRVTPEVLIVGLGRYGLRLAQGLKSAGLHVHALDFDPEVARSARQAGFHVYFGDANDADSLAEIPLGGIPWIVSTLPDIASNRVLLQGLAEKRFDGKIAVVARDEVMGEAMETMGSPKLLYPMRNAVDHAVTALTKLIHT